MIDKRLWPILLVSILLRVGAALYFGNEVVSLPGTNDQISYHTLALRLIGGHGFSFGENWWPATVANTPTAHWSYLYTFYLASVYTLFGPHPLAARLIQAIIVGALQPYLAYRLMQQAFLATPPVENRISRALPARRSALESPESNMRSTLPLIAAALTALYIYFIYYAATLMTEPFFIVGLMGSLSVLLALAARASHARGYLLALALGTLFGVTVLLRQAFLLMIPLLLGWLFVVGYRRGRRWVDAGMIGAMVALCLAIMIAPFTIYNYARFHRFVLLNTNAGYALYLANHPSYGATWIPASRMESYGDLIPSELRGLDEAALEQELAKRASAFIRADPVRYLRLSLSRFPSYIKFWPDPESGLISNIARSGSFGLLLPFILFGLIRPWLLESRDSSRGFRFRWPPAEMMLIYLFVAAYLGMHLLTWTQIRYRIPVDALLVLFATLPIADVIQHVGWQPRRSSAPT